MLYRALEWSLMSLMRHVGTIHWTKNFKLLPPKPDATWFATSIVINKFQQRYPFPPSIFVKALIILRCCSKFWGWDMLIFFLSGLNFLDVLGHQRVPCVQFPPGPSVGVTNVQRTKPEPQTQRSVSIRPTLHSFHFAFQLSSLKMEPTTVGFFFRLFESPRSWKDMGNFAMCSKHVYRPWLVWPLIASSGCHQPIWFFKISIYMKMCLIRSFRR